jgi:hypothetical protein
LTQAQKEPEIKACPANNRQAWQFGDLTLRFAVSFREKLATLYDMGSRDAS